MVKAFEMDLARGDGVVRRKTHRYQDPTDTFVNVTAWVEKVGDHEFERVRLSVKDVPCPNCHTPNLKCDYNDAETCPKCGSTEFTRTVIL